MTLQKIGAQQLSKRVTRAANDANLAPERLRRWVASAALLEGLRVAVEHGVLERYVVKGGYSIEARFTKFARASEDIDLAIETPKDLLEGLRDALSFGWADFTFREKGVQEREFAFRVTVQVRFNNADWCTLKIDLVRERQAMVEVVEPIDVVRFGLPALSGIPCLSRAQQIAQYVHAITAPPVNGKYQDRSRNIVDLFLIDSIAPCDDGDVRVAMIAIFEQRATHPFPVESFAIPAEWRGGLAALATDIGLNVTATELIDFFRTYVLRIIGVIVNKAYEYEFTVLTPTLATPNATQPVFQVSHEVETIKNLTEDQGFRLVQLLPYPGGPRALLAVFEREKTLDS